MRKWYPNKPLCSTACRSHSSPSPLHIWGCTLCPILSSLLCDLTQKQTLVGDASLHSTVICSKFTALAPVHSLVNCMPYDSNRRIYSRSSANFIHSIQSAHRHPKSPPTRPAGIRQATSTSHFCQQSNPVSVSGDRLGFSLGPDRDNTVKYAPL